jgi:hypothetical protein
MEDRMRTVGRSILLGLMAMVLVAAGPGVGEVVLKDLSLDKPLILDENTDYHLENVSVTGVSDCAAITLSGRIKSVKLLRCTFGRVWMGADGKAAGLDCAGAMVGMLNATGTTFFDAENQLATLKDGSFGKVTFERCRFYTSASFLKQIYTNNPWRNTPPVTEFWHIDRLELLDNEYSNTTIVIHPSVKQVVLRGALPGLKLEDPQATRLIRLQPGEAPESVPDLASTLAAGVAQGAPKG